MKITRADKIIVDETNIDDSSPELLGYTKRWQLLFKKAMMIMVPICVYDPQ